MTRLRSWRIGNDYTLHEVSDITGFSEAFLSRLEREQREASAETKKVIARRLGVSISDLFEVEEVPDSDAA